MPNLGNKSIIYLARFRFQGREYKKSLKTSDRKAATAAIHRVEDALHQLAIRVITVPEGADSGDFISSSGTLEAPIIRQAPPVMPALGAAITEFLANLSHLL